METLKSIWEGIAGVLVALKVNHWYLLLWISAGYIQKQYFKDIYPKIGDAWKTMVLGSVFSLVYALLNRPVALKATWVEFFASYVFATSLYELLIKDLVNRTVDFFRTWYQKKLNG